MKINNNNKKFLAALLGVLCAEFFWMNSVYASGSGFIIPVKSISDLGNEFAGGAALASDASTNYYNPAGIVRIDHPELIGGLTYVYSPAKFEGSTTAPSATTPPGLPLPPSPYNGTGTASTYQHGFLPTLHFVTPIYSDRVFLGFSLTTPAGLGNKYNSDSIVRYTNTKSTAEVINLGLSLATKITNNLSIGAGPDFQYFKTEFVNYVRTQPITDTDSNIDINASSWGYGWHAGLLYQFTPATRVGLSYISKVVQHLTGTSDYTMSPTTPMLPPPYAAATQHFNSSNVEIEMVLPPVTLLSAYHDLNEKWAVMGTAGYTQWNVLKSISMNNVNSPIGNISTSIPENYHNTWSFAAAVNYKLNEQWLFRLGMGTDSTASDDGTRDTITPDAFSFATNIGFHFQQNKTVGWDVAYSHAFIKNSNINNINSTSGTTETGTYRRQGNVIGVQMVLNLENLFKTKSHKS